ncbi:MAG: glycoside hydrolase family 127 protein [Acidobacteria bacterium]|nr:glycoside hydrolase family 127 protein [Acidobacteriota bacterium]
MSTATVGGFATTLAASTSFDGSFPRYLPSTRVGELSSGPSPWSICEFGKISVGGDLAKRTQQNWQRLQHAAYRVPKIFDSMTAKDWPGDWVARTLLGTILLARSTGQDAPETKRIVSELPSHLNKEGYFGEIIDPDALTEQQLGSPPGWLMRALYEYNAWTREPVVLEMLHNLVRKLALPMKDWWESYPITPDVRHRGEGGVIGGEFWRAGRWILSSDIGNEFMLLDGLTQAWQLDRSSELKAAIDQGIERFLKTDLLALQAQTHASLTTLRALLRMFALTGDASLLRAVEERYALYRQVAMTENYANYNWFGRPETWTEPCAVIDSFIVAMQLWQFTGQPQYLEDAHLIWFNGVGRGQRATGGFGCDSCAGVDDPYLKMKLVYEAFFCCTMRGGEGHSYAIQSAYHTCPGELAVTFYTDSKADLDLGYGRVVLHQSTQYPYEAGTKLNVISSTVATPIALRMFAPSWVSNPRLKLNGRSLASQLEKGFLVAHFTPRRGDALALDGTLKNWVRPTLNPRHIRGYYAFHAGPLMLGYEGEKEVLLPAASDLVAQGPGRFQVQGKDVMLGRINDLNEFALPSWDPLDPTPADPDKRARLENLLLTEVPSYRRQVLFREA